MTEQKTGSTITKHPVRPQARRRRWLGASFLFFVLLPAILGSLYITMVASDRYVAEAGFAVRSMKAAGGMDLLGSFTGLAGSGSSTADSYIVMKYLKSRDLLEQLQRDFDFKAAYGKPEIDVLSRLDPALDIEKVLDYWERRISTSYDPTARIINIEVQAFTPEDAQRVTELVLGYVQELTNELSEKARRDAVAYAESEVKRAETRLLNARNKLRTFREDERAIDPSASAMAQLELLTGLERKLLEIQTRMAALSESLDNDAPSLKALRRQAVALEQQITDKSGGLSVTGADEDLSGLLSDYEELQLEKNFAEKAYSSALASMETARIEAGRQQRYLAIYKKPALPEYPLYPRRILYPALLVVVLSGLWGIGSLIVYAVRDHLSAGSADYGRVKPEGAGLSRKMKKLKENPHRFFNESSIAPLRPLRHLFRNKQKV